MSDASRIGKRLSGVFVEAEAHDGTKAVSQLGTRTDVRHTVRVRNLMVYDASVRADGWVPDRSRICFSARASGASPLPSLIYLPKVQSSVTETNWAESLEPLGEGESCQFDSALLIPRSQGKQSVFAKVAVAWPERGPLYREVRLRIEVEV